MSVSPMLTIDADMARMSFIERRASELASDYNSTRAEKSLYVRILQEICEDVQRYWSAENSHSIDRLNYLMSESEHIIDVVFQTALSSKLNRMPECPLNFWEHVAHPSKSIKKDDFIIPNRSEWNEVAEYYISGRFKSRLLDRTLIDLLVASEFLNYAREMLNPVSLFGITTGFSLKSRGPILDYAINAVLTVILFGGLAAAIAMAVGASWMPDWGLAIAWGLGALVVLSLLLGILFLPSRWIAWTKARRLATELMQQMHLTYHSIAGIELYGHGMISAHYVLHRAKCAGDKGVSWPPALFVLLDDVIIRSGRI
jgi:hypothetical protein